MPAGGTVTISAENRKLGGGRTGPGLPPATMCGLRSPTPAPASAPDRSREGDGALLHDQGASARAAALASAWSMASPSNRTARSGSTASSARARRPSCGCRARRTESVPRPTRPKRSEDARPTAASFAILLVDDHAEVRSTTAAVLEDFGHKVVEAANGAEALASAQGRRMRLRLADQRLCDAASVRHRIPAPGASSIVPAFPR